MNLNQLLRYDLSLLICLHVLLEECNVTRASQRLHLSQSAVSKSLSKLREQFDDPLFNRTSRGLHPTPKALSLKPGLKNLLQHVEGLTISDEFDSATSDRRFHLSLVESAYLCSCLAFWERSLMRRLLSRSIPKRGEGIPLMPWHAARWILVLQEKT